MTFEVQVSIPYFNALPRDVATNSWHFDRIGTAPGPTEYAALVLALDTFYSNVYGPANSMASYGNPDGTHFKIYDLGDTPPRAPKYDVVEPIAADVATATVLPPEVAVVCSIAGVGISGVPIASQRGRVYLGVLGDAAATAGTNVSFPTVAEAFRAQVVVAAEQLVGDSVTAGFTWVILSRKLGATFPVVKGFCDDAFDIQRRRGQDPSIRETWAI